MSDTIDETMSNLEPRWMKVRKKCSSTMILWPLKCPTIFNSAEAAVMTRTDLVTAAEFDEAAAMEDYRHFFAQRCSAQIPITAN